MHTFPNPAANVESTVHQGLQWIAVVSVLFLIGINASAQEVYTAKQETSDEYDVLFVSESDNGEGYAVNSSAEATGDENIKEGTSAKKVIEWALARARVTVLTEGEYVVAKDSQVGVKITEDNVSLIIGPNATLASSGEVKPHLILVHMADNVNVFNLGTIDLRRSHIDKFWERGDAIRYEGQHGTKGASGVNGGIILSPGQIRYAGRGCLILDAEDMTVPLFWVEGKPISMEGVQDAEIGTVGHLGLGEAIGEGETIDMNMSCKDIHIRHVIGLAPKPGDEIVDINNSHYVTVDRITAFQGEGFDGALLVGYDLYGHDGNTNRPKLHRQKGHNIKWTERIRKDVAGFRRKVTFPDYPKSLPALNVDVRLIVEFEDGSTWELYNKKYRFDL